MNFGNLIYLTTWNAAAARISDGVIKGARNNVKYRCNFLAT